MDTSGNITTVAGTGGCCYSGDGGPATSAQMNNPQGVAVDAAGNLYIADWGNRIRKVNTSGIITTVAGNGNTGYSGDGGAAASAQLANPEGVAVDVSGDLYIADWGNSRIRKVSAAGNISTLVGGPVGDGGLGALGSLSQPVGVARDSAGNTYIADTNENRVRKVAANGTITTVAGTGTLGYSGDGGPAASAWLNQPRGLALDASGNLYIADSNNYRIRKVDTSGNITTVAGYGSCCSAAGDGGAATSARFGTVYGIALDAAGDLYIADGNNSRIRMVNTSGTITTVAGTGTSGYSGDGGAATSAQLNYPYGVAVDTAGKLYIADQSNQRIRKVDTSGNITTVAGSGTSGYSGDGGAATSAQLYYPEAVAVDSAGNLYIADLDNQLIRKVTAAGIITTVAGNQGYGYSGDGGPAVNASFRSPSALSVDASGYVVIADQANNAVRLLTPAGTSAVLSIQSGHSGSFTLGQTGAAYTLTVANGSGAAATAGAVTVTEVLPAGMTLASMSGTGWTCTVSSATCTRSDALSGGSSYPAITVTVNVSASALAQLTNEASVTGGGAPAGGAQDLTLIVGSSAPAAPVLTAPANGATGVLSAPLLTWNTAAGATSYDVYFGTASAPTLATNIGVAAYAPGTLSAGTTYYWAVGARNSVGATESSAWSFSTSCVSALSPSARRWPRRVHGIGSGDGDDPAAAGRR